MNNPSPHKHVHRLLQGQETELGIDILVKLTSISSEDVIDALKAHYVHGMPLTTVYWVHDIKQQAFNRASQRLNEVFNLVQQYNGIQ